MEPKIKPIKRTRPRYPWLKWFSRRGALLKKGRDFYCSAPTMAAQVRNAASRLGLSVSVQHGYRWVEFHLRRRKHAAA